MSNFVPEYFLDFDESKGSLYYLVKWKGIPRHMSSWEPAESLDLSEDLLTRSKKYLEKASKNKAKKVGESKKGKRLGRPPKVKTLDCDEIVEVLQDDTDELWWVVQTNSETKKLSTHQVRQEHAEALLDFLIPKIHVDKPKR